MPKTPQYAFRLPPEHIRLLSERAERLQSTLGIQVTRTDALRLLLDFADKVEHVRAERLRGYREMMETLPPGPDRDRARAAHDDWLTMNYDRMLGLAEIQAAATLEAKQIRNAARAAGRNRLSAATIREEIRDVRKSRKRRG